MAERKDPMIPDGAVNPIDTDYQIGQDNMALVHYYQMLI